MKSPGFHEFHIIFGINMIPKICWVAQGGGLVSKRNLKTSKVIISITNICKAEDLMFIADIDKL